MRGWWFVDSSPRQNRERLEEALANTAISTAVKGKRNLFSDDTNIPHLISANKRFAKPGIIKQALAFTALLLELIAEHAVQGCMEARQRAQQCPLAAAAIGRLECSMQDIADTIEVAIQVDPSLTQAVGEDQLYCSYILTRILHYIDLMILYTPFALYQEGRSADDALQEAFLHWGLGRDGIESNETLTSTSLLQEKYVGWGQ